MEILKKIEIAREHISFDGYSFSIYFFTSFSSPFSPAPSDFFFLSLQIYNHVIFRWEKKIAQKIQVQTCKDTNCDIQYVTNFEN